LYLNPWTDQLRLEKNPNPPLISAREKMPFEVTPLFPYLVRVREKAENQPAPASQPAPNRRR
ncbi:MAG: hypothetical protein ACRD2F_08105, partial [Terriglobales bacterium]